MATSSSAATAGDVDEEGMQVKDAGSVKNMAKELERIRRATRPKTPVEVHADSWSQGKWEGNLDAEQGHALEPSTREMLDRDLNSYECSRLSESLPVVATANEWVVVPAQGLVRLRWGATKSEPWSPRCGTTTDGFAFLVAPNAAADEEKGSVDGSEASLDARVEEPGFKIASVYGVEIKNLSGTDALNKARALHDTHGKVYGNFSLVSCRHGTGTGQDGGVSLLDAVLGNNGYAYQVIHHCAATDFNRVMFVARNKVDGKIIGISLILVDKVLRAQHRAYVGATTAWIDHYLASPDGFPLPESTKPMEFLSAMRLSNAIAARTDCGVFKVAKPLVVDLHNKLKDATDENKSEAGPFLKKPQGSSPGYQVISEMMSMLTVGAVRVWKAHQVVKLAMAKARAQGQSNVTAETVVAKMSRHELMRAMDRLGSNAKFFAELCVRRRVRLLALTPVDIGAGADAASTSTGPGLDARVVNCMETARAARATLATRLPYLRRDVGNVEFWSEASEKLRKHRKDVNKLELFTFDETLLTLRLSRHAGVEHTPVPLVKQGGKDAGKPDRRVCALSCDLCENHAAGGAASSAWASAPTPASSSSWPPSPSPPPSSSSLSSSSCPSHSRVARNSVTSYMCSVCNVPLRLDPAACLGGRSPWDVWHDSVELEHPYVGRFKAVVATLPAAQSNSNSVKKSRTEARVLGGSRSSKSSSKLDLSKESPPRR